MAFRLGKWDSVIIGGLLGLSLTYPQLSSWFADWIGEILPVSWQFLDSWSIQFYGILAGMLVGYIAEKSR